MVDSKEKIITGSLTKTPSDTEGGVVAVMSGPLEGVFTATLRIKAAAMAEVALLT